MVEMRRLGPEQDAALVAEALSWTDGQPRWLQDADAVWGTVEAESYLKQMREDAQADFGVFEGGQLIAVITVSLEGKGIYNSHLMVKRGAKVESVVICAASVMKGLFENGMKEGWSWIAARNHGVGRILEAIGMRRDGIEQIKGQTHGRPITWQRYSVRAA